MSIQLQFRESGQGPPLIILHGVFGSGDNWLTVSKLFTPHFRVFLVDQRNHGRSPQTMEFSYDLLVEDLSDFADQLGLPRFFLIGHSMGGKVAMKFAARYPERLEKLVVVDIAPRFYKPHHRDVVAGLKAVSLDKVDSRMEAEKAMEPFIPESDVRQFLLKNLYRTEEGRFAWRINLPVLENAVDQIGEELDTSVRIRVPTLFIRGDQSRYISDQDVSRIATQFPQSRVETISNTGHWVQAQQPQAFGQAVLSFFLSVNFS